MEAGVRKVVPKRVPEMDPKPDPLWAARVLGKALNSKGFGAFWPLRGMHFWAHFRAHFGLNFGPPRFITFSRNLEKRGVPLKAKWILASPENIDFEPRS